MPGRVGTGDLLPIAAIGRPRGNRGEVVIHPYFDLRSEGLSGCSLVARKAGAEDRTLRLERIWWHGERTICHFQGLQTIGQARELTGAELLAPREALAPLQKDEFFVTDLVGCVAALADGSKLGQVEGIMQTGGTDVLIVRTGAGKELLVPLAREIVTEINLEDGLLVVDPPDGLLELNEN